MDRKLRWKNLIQRSDLNLDHLYCFFICVPRSPLESAVGLIAEYMPETSRLGYIREGHLHDDRAGKRAPEFAGEPRERLERVVGPLGSKSEHVSKDLPLMGPGIHTIRVFSQHTGHHLDYLAVILIEDEPAANPVRLRSAARKRPQRTRLYEALDRRVSRFHGCSVLSRSRLR
jgi:hypothetical protein